MARFFASLLVVIALSAVSAPAALQVDDGTTYLEQLDAAVEDGLLDTEQALLHAFAYGFDHDALPEEWRPETFPALRCGSGLVRRYLGLKGDLSPDAVQRIEGYLSAAPSADKAIHTSPLGYFTLTYETSGIDAVTLDDVDPANGVPDLVERCAEYLDTSWQVEIETMGYPAPPNVPYPVSFENMSFYGYISMVTADETRIVLNNTFEGLPGTNDPDGDVLGAAKAVCAHEFRHASQRVQSGWSEGEWVELDAVWIEDMVFDESDLYYNDLMSGSGISDPDLPLDDGGTGSYEDCIWQHWMSETYGVEIIGEFWDRRSDHTAEPVLTTYDVVLQARGGSLAEGLAAYGAWNAVTGVRAVDGVGYQEAVGYPTGPAVAVGIYPGLRSGSTAPLAADNIFCFEFSSLPGLFGVEFDGDDDAPLSLTAVVHRFDGTGVIETVALDEENKADTSLGVSLDEANWVMLVISQTGGTDDAAWSLAVDPVEPEPAIEVGTLALTHVQYLDDTGYEIVTVANTGPAGSVLTLTGTVSETVSWLISFPAGPVDVAAGDTIDFILVFDTAGLSPGEHAAAVVFDHNAPSPPQVIDVTLAVIDPAVAVPDAPGPLRILGNHPNPFNPSTSISFSLAEPGRAVVEVFDFRGRLVRTLLDRDLPAGPATAAWDGRDAAGRPAGSGAYRVRVRSGGVSASHSMILSK